jgi:quercetin dioxygenase-like cupin family protein
MYIKQLNKIPKEEIKAAVKTWRQILISLEEAPNFAMRKFTIEPGGEMPMHTNTVEHEQLIVCGSAEVIINDQRFEVKKDDIVFIPAGIPHSYKTIGNEPFEFICVVPNKQDTMEVIKQ